MRLEKCHIKSPLGLYTWIDCEQFVCMKISKYAQARISVNQTECSFAEAGLCCGKVKDSIAGVNLA